jgi:hypothetical protein
VAPLLDEDLDFLEAVEDFTIEQLVPQLAVEAFAIAVLPRAAGLDIESFGATPANQLRTTLAVISGPLSNRISAAAASQSTPAWASSSACPSSFFRSNSINSLGTKRADQVSPFAMNGLGGTRE